MIRLLYVQGKNLQYPLDRRLGGPQIWSGRGSEDKEIPSPPCRESNTGRPARRLASVLTKLP